MEGHAHSLKERTLATDVFDRPSSWDSGEDTIVRGGAREVRKRLAQYYASPEGMQERVRFELAPGSYVPLFLYAESVEAPPQKVPVLSAEDPVKESEVPRPQPPWRPGAWPFWAVGIGLTVAVAIALAAKFSPASAFDEFWNPIWRSPDPVLIAIAHPIVYHPSSRAVHLNNQRLGPSRLPIQRPLQLLPKELDGSDMVPVLDQYVGYGDALAASDISALMGRHSGSVRIRSADKLEFADLREAPSALIGSFTNRWTVELSEPFRIHFGYNVRGIPELLDSTIPARHWNIPSKKDDGTASDDYFLICRLSNSPSGKLMLIAAGLTQFGTEAAGRLLADPERLNDTLRKIGRNWQSRNLELVFHAKVVENSTSASELIAWHVW
ncbi:MAG TPA: hypothetical protein VK604_05240 [Bryobacteraceae bacterium]|nr:hypothetical protein [Bryobacteraceae bacterium]